MENTEPGRVYPQPHEGITGTDRHDTDLLSLEEAAMPRRDMMREMAKLLRSATLVGNPAPSVSRMSDRMQKPRPGDLVMEESSAWTRDPDTRLKGFGILVCRRDEWWDSDDSLREFIAKHRADGDELEYAAKLEQQLATGVGRPVDDAWYVQYGPDPADVCRWTNCLFTAIPVGEDFSVRVGTPTERGGVMLTRDDLLSTLEDSGFALNPAVRGAALPFSPDDRLGRS